MITVLLVVFLLLQIIPLNNRGKSISSDSFKKSMNVPSDVVSILSKSCYDCHSNSTIYPDYAKWQPAALFIEKHVTTGKKNLNFDEFSTYSERKKKAKIRSIISQIDNDKMPLKSYLLLHPKARLDSTQKKMLLNFFKNID